MIVSLFAHSVVPASPAASTPSVVILREGGGSTSFFPLQEATRGWSAFADHDEKMNCDELCRCLEKVEENKTSSQSNEH
jgi:hypothetical protein